MKRILLLLLASFYLCSCVSQKEHKKGDFTRLKPVQIIPEPNKFFIFDGVFFITDSTQIKNDSGLNLQDTIELFTDELLFQTNIKLKAGKAKKDYIQLKLSKNRKSAEWYKLQVSTKKIVINANSSAGFLYAFYSLLQLVKKNSNSSGFYIRCLQIEDEPRFEYRGLMLDVSRHFFPIETIKKIIDKIAKLKINKFHFHLTDDGGFRFPFEGQIKINNRIYDLSAFIKKTSYRTGKNKNSGDYNEEWSFVDISDPSDKMYKYRQNAHGGFYTRDELKDLIAYAKKRNIEIIPELDIPGHSYPLNYFFEDMRCDKKNSDNRDAGILTDICPTSLATIVILKEMIKQIAEVFESPIIHIGSDEVKINNNSWYKIGSWWFCSRCEKKIKELEGRNASVNYKNLQKLQAWFLKQIETIVEHNGKKMAIWNDGMRGGFKPSKNTIVYFWDNKEDLKKAKKKKLKIVNCDQWKYYLDLYQYEDDRKRGILKAQDWGGYAPTVDLKTVYENNPIVEKYGSSLGKTQIGIQANMWCEEIIGFEKDGKVYSRDEHLLYMIFPRIIAVAESAWSFETNKNWKNFKKKLENFKD